MDTTVLSLDNMSEMFNPEEDWLFEKIQWKLVSGNHLILLADQGWGIQEYISELRFQLEEKYAEMRTCLVDFRSVRSSISFLHIFASTFLNTFPKETFNMDIDSSNESILYLPERIAKIHKLKIIVFIGNVHLIHRLSNSDTFLRTLKSKFRTQNNCVYCLYGNNSPQLRSIYNAPGPLFGFARIYELKHNPENHRSASIRKLFHNNKKRIGTRTSQQFSLIVDNNPHYMRLLSWHALLLTRNTCTQKILEQSLDNLIQHYDHPFGLIIERLTSNQVGFMKALVDGYQKLFAATTREHYQLGSTSNVAKIKSSLENRQIIQCSRMGIEFTDPIFRIWLERRYFSRY